MSDICLIFESQNLLYVHDSIQFSRVVNMLTVCPFGGK